MKLERIGDALMLRITSDGYVSFRAEWIEQLRALPYDQYGEYIRTTIYPALSDMERKLWNKATINNRVLREAVQEAS